MLLTTVAKQLKTHKLSFVAIPAMASLAAVAIAGFMHIVVRYSFYLSYLPRREMPGPAFPTVIVCIAVLDLIYDNRLVPHSLNSIGHLPKLIFETGAAIFFLEIAMLVFWANIEYMTFLVAHVMLLGFHLVSEETYAKHQTLIIGLFTVPLSIFILALVGLATGHFHIHASQHDHMQTTAALRADNARTLRFLQQREDQQDRVLRRAYRELSVRPSDH